MFFFFFQAEDGIRDLTVTGVQTCALPISQDDLDDALAVIQEFDPIGVGSRDLRECLFLQLKAFDPQNTLAQQIVSEHLKQVQSNQLKEIARALNRPLEVVKRALDVIKKLDPRQIGRAS